MIGWRRLYEQQYCTITTRVLPKRVFEKDKQQHSTINVAQDEQQEDEEKDSYMCHA